MVWFKSYTEEEFFRILYQEDVPLIRSILYWQGDLANAQDSEWRPLVYASYRGNTELARAILETAGKRLDVNQKDRMGYSPLLWAVSRDFFEIAHLLMNHNDIDVNVRGKDNETPLLAASLYNRPMIVQRLLYHGARVGVLDKQGCSPLSRACLQNHFTIVQMLLNAGATPNMRNYRCGHTPLAESCILNHDSIVKLLIQAGAEVNAVNYHGSTPLLLAVKAGSLNTIYTLLKNGADWNKSNDADEAPLSVAAACKSYEACRVLMEYQQSEDTGAANVKYSSLSRHKAGVVAACT